MGLLNQEQPERVIMTTYVSKANAKRNNSKHPQDVQITWEVKEVAYPDPKREGMYMTSVYFTNYSDGRKEKKYAGLRGKKNQAEIMRIIKEDMIELAL